MSDSSPSLSKDSGSDQMQQSRRVGLRNENNDKNNQKLSPQELFNQIVRAIKGAKEHRFLTYEGVDPQTGSLVVDSLREDAEVERVRPR